MIATQSLTRDGFTAVFAGNRVDVYHVEGGDRVLIDTIPVGYLDADDIPTILAEVLDEVMG